MLRLSRLTALSVVLSVSTVTLANEAPVVDAQQSQSAVTTQPASSAESGWQTVSNDHSAQPNSSPNVQAFQQRQPRIAAQQWVSAPREPDSGDASSLNHRVARLEQQISNYNQMNLPQQVSDMQQKMSQLQGQLEVDQHALKTLTDQQKVYYQDIEQQLAQLQKTKSFVSSDVNAMQVADAASTENTLDKNIITTTPTQKTNPAASNPQQPTVAQSAPVTQLTAPTEDDTNAYDKAFRLLSRKHFNQAQTAFHDYLKAYPQGHFSVNAHFWLGEIALMNQHYDVASKQFQTVVRQYPKSDKTPDAKLKIAMIHAAQGNTDLAKKEFTQIRKDYPGTTAAQLASIRLQQISGGMIS